MYLNIKDTSQKTLLVQIEITGSKEKRLAKDRHNEFKELVLSSGANIVAGVRGRQEQPVASTFIKKGKISQIKNKVKDLTIDLVIFNHDLSPSQERNLETIFKSRVLDRTGLILDIFALRAKSHTGKLQVELAQLSHLSTRLVRGWSHLERQRGGIGLRGGPGEKQLETDRRLINQRIKTINKKLNKVHQQRTLNKYSRQKSKNILISLIGYTNSGKTTLFNVLTGSDQYVANQPFATLDSVTRKNKDNNLSPFLFSDTVGFISELPTQLIESFKATLDELKSADLILHVVDISDSNYLHKLEEVNNLLDELDISHIQQLRVNNKIDKIGNKDILEDYCFGDIEVWISAKEELGISNLQESMIHCVNKEVFVGWISLKSSLGRVRSNLYSLGYVEEEKTSTSSGLIQLKIKMGREYLQELLLEKGVKLVDSNKNKIEVAV